MTNREEEIDDIYVAKNTQADLSDFNLDDQPSPKRSSPEHFGLTENERSFEREPLSSELPSEEEPSMTWIMFRELLETIVLSLIIFLLMRQVVQNYRIESQSMEPNFCEGQFILVNKLAYVLGEPHRGDVVVFHNPNNQDQDYIKRIIGLPGDTLAIRNGTVFINGNDIEDSLNESYLQYQVPPNQDFGPLVIESDKLFVMGDNRPNSSDSRREVGQLSQDLLVGKAWLRVWPFDRWGLIQHFAIEPGITLDPEVAKPANGCLDS